MRIDPEERQGAVSVHWQGQVLTVQCLICVSGTDLIIQVKVLLLEPPPVFLDIGSRAWQSGICLVF